MSILSEREDGFGFHYGYREGDRRQINVRYEEDTFLPHKPGSFWWGWAAYVGGELVDTCETKDQAEAAAIKWAEDNPPQE